HYEFTNSNFAFTGLVKKQGKVYQIEKKFIEDDKFTVEIRFWISKVEGVRIAQHVDFADANEPFHDVTLVIEGEKVY
ncbi:hypothetical protein PMAYCL1PPCAC_25203, partial [Pristionchus mayeri]